MERGGFWTGLQLKAGHWQLRNRFHILFQLLLLDLECFLLFARLSDFLYFVVVLIAFDSCCQNIEDEFEKTFISKITILK